MTKEKHEVKVVAASRYEGVGLYTFRLRYWRAMHAEFLTHRTHNRCSSSSRAIPIAKMNQMVLEDTAGPTHWGKNQSGMQAFEEHNEPVVIPGHLALSWAKSIGAEYSPLWDDGVVVTRQEAWKFSAWLAVSMSNAFAEAGYHKQIANRITEPYQYINVVLTATEDRLEDFFKLRDHQDAFPELRDVAHGIRVAKDEAQVQELAEGEWHLPFVLPEEKNLSLSDQLILSSARCAHTSYETVEGLPLGVQKAVSIFQKLVGSDPIHASPTEHQARAGLPALEALPQGLKANWHVSPLSGEWVQHRKFIENYLGPV